MSDIPKNTLKSSVHTVLVTILQSLDTMDIIWSEKLQQGAQ
jgi:hypothetical protein